MELMRSDEFLDLPAQSQLLYVHLSVEADDDGFLCGKKRIIAMLGYTEKTYEALVAAGFILAFPSGAAVITHWPLLNKVPRDRYTSTRHQAEKSMLEQVPGVGYALKKETKDTEKEPEETEEQTQQKETADIEKSATVSQEPTGEKSTSPESTCQTVASLPASGGSYPVTTAEAEEWQRLYPEVDVRKELFGMRSWLLTHPEKQKTADQIGRFVNYWLSNARTRAQASPGGFPSVGASGYSNRLREEHPPSYDLERFEQRMKTTVPKLKKRDRG